MKHLFLSIVLVSICSLCGISQPATLKLDSTELQIRVIAEGLTIPWDLVWAPDGTIWFTEREGNIKRIDPETGNIDLIHTVDEVFQSNDNSGMHAMTFHPDFPFVPYVYVNYTYELTWGKAGPLYL